MTGDELERFRSAVENAIDALGKVVAAIPAQPQSQPPTPQPPPPSGQRLGFDNWIAILETYAGAKTSAQFNAFINWIFFSPQGLGLNGQIELSKALKEQSITESRIRELTQTYHL